MSNYPELADVFTDKVSGDTISSSDPNNCFNAIENVEGLIGALGKPQSWSTTLMTLLSKYQRGMSLYVSGGTMTLKAGEAVLQNSDATKWCFRQNTSDVTISASNLDVGSMAVATYYVYLKGGTATSTAPVIFSTDANYPSAIGTIPYKKVGVFWNMAVGSLNATVAYSISNDTQALPNQLGEWEGNPGYYLGTVYLALSDGFITGFISCNGNDDAFILTDTSNPPTTVRGRAYLDSGLLRSPFCVPIKKDNYWKISANAGSPTATIYWMPLIRH